MPTIQEYLSTLFEEHGLACMIHNEWILPNSDLPILRAFWYPNGPSGELDVQIVVRENVIIEECFAGIGEGDTGLSDALANFTTTIFHVLLAALWQKDESEQVVPEDWEVNGKGYTAYPGNFIVRSFESIQPEIPSELFPNLQQTIQSEPLTGDIHWFRLFLGNLKGDFTYEATKDNEVWDPGVRCL